MQKLGSAVGALALWASLAAPISAQDAALPDSGVTIVEQGPVLGEETNLPLPRYVSLKASEANVRRGPSLGHRIDWVFTRRDMPLMVVAEYGHWRKVLDQDGQGGWVHYTLLSGTRTVVTLEPLEPLYTREDTNGPQVALLEQGVIAYVLSCDTDWCRLSVGGFRGYAPKTAFWGVGDDEIIE